MIEFHGVGLQRGGRWLFRDVSFKIPGGWKTGVIGANGSGKSSLLGLIEQTLEPDNGRLGLGAGDRVATLPQETPSATVSALEFALDGDGELKRLQSERVAAQNSGCGQHIATVHGRLEAIDAYAAPARAARVLSGLGFSEGDQSRPVDAFSGGWRMRLALAKVLMARSDLLILDEPTNHLDLDAVLWLQGWIKLYPGTLILVSHDRELLDSCTDHTLAIAASGVRLVRGNYSAYERIRAQELAQQVALKKKQDLDRERLEGFVERFRAKATKARQAQSRLKALARLGETVPAHADAPIRFSLPDPGRTPDPLLSLRQVSFHYASQEVLSEVDLGVRRGSRIGLLGPNGAGKSTLMRLLAGQLTPGSGTRSLAPGVGVGYLAQHSTEQLELDLDATTHLRLLSPGTGETRIRDHLGGFGFSGSRALEPVASYSGGEKARLALALMVWQAPALLLLDEPTNHLDLEVRHALTLALQAFEGAMVLVSHDRYLLRACCDELLLVSDGRLSAFEGDLDDYERWLREGRRRERDRSDSGSPSARDRRRLEAERRQARALKRRPLEKRLQQLEVRMEQLEAQRTALRSRLAEQNIYAAERAEELREALLRSGVLDGEIEGLEGEWLETSEALEDAE